MSNTIFKGVVQLSKEQFEELKTNGRLTANGEDLIYNPSAVLYVTDMFIYVPSKLSEFEDYKEVIDNVTSTSTTNPLSANQGKLLNDKITSVLEKVNGKVQTFTVQTIEDLMALFGLDIDEVKDSYKVETSIITYKEKSYSLKDGDMFLIVNTEVPDYWFSLSDMTLYKMETAKVDLSNYAQKDEIPTKVSELDNDSNFATEDYVNTNGGKIDTISVNGETQTITNKNVDITIPTKVSEIENDKKYATEDYVNTNGGKIDTISLNGVEQTITDKNVNLDINYYKVENKQSKIDLNTIVIPGNYGIASDCTNKPGNLSGTLYVGNYLDTTYAQQTFVDSEGKTWVRVSTSVDNSTWSTWDQLAKIKDIPTDLSKFENAADGVVDNQYATKKYVKDYVVDITASELEGYVSGLNYYSEDVFNVTTDPTGEPNKSYDYYSMDYDKNMAIQPIIGEEVEIPYRRESSSSHHPFITDCTYDMIWDTENPNKISFKYTGPTDVEVNNGNVAVTVFGDNFFYPAISVLPLESNSSYYVKITSVTTNGDGQTQNRHFGLLYLSCGYSNDPMEEGNNGRLYFVSGRDTYRGKYLPRRKTNEFLLNTGPEANSFLMLNTLLPKINGWTYTYTFEIRKAETNINKIIEENEYIQSKANANDIPTDNSQLTNGAGYIKKSVQPISINSQFAVSTSENDLANNITTTQPTGQSSVRMRSIIYANDKWVIAGTSGAVEYSIDNGNTWTLGTQFTSNVITSITYGKGQFVCVDSAGGLFKSQDAINWEQINTGETRILEQIKYINGRFTMVGGNGYIAFSDDLEKINVAETGVTYNFINLTYGKDRYIAVTDNGHIMYSLDGVTWLDSSISGDTTHYRSAIYGKGMFVIGGQGGTIRYSNDGITWNTATNNTTSSVNYIRDIIYVDGKFFAVMYISTGAGEVWTSLDGMTWTVFENLSSANTRLWAVTNGNDVVIATGDNGIIRRYDLNIDWLDVEPQLSNSQVLWQKTQQYLSDGSMIESEVEVHTNLTDVYSRLNNIPTKVSDLTNDTGFIVNTVSNLTNYYNKSSTYSKDEVNTLVNNIQSFNAVIVSSLPTSDISTSTIYLVAKSNSTSGDYYEEHLYINGSWENIGKTTIDLSNYYTKSETYSKTEVNNLITATEAKIPTVNYPVTSVNSKTGAVTLSASDVGVNITLNGNQTANPSFYAPDTVGENSQILTSSGSTTKTPRWQNVSSITDEQNTTKTSMKSSVWKTKTWSGLTTFYGSNIWTDGENVYYSEGANQYVLNKVNSTWEPKTWSGLTSFNGTYIWSNGDNIYYSYNYTQFELDISTGTWKNKEWAGLGTTKINGNYIWSDGKTTYYSEGSKQYSLSFKSSQWYTKTWNGFSSYQSTNFYGNDVWFDGTNIRYQTLALDVSTSTWNYKTGAAGMSDFYGRYVWTDGEHIYYSRYNPSGSGVYSYMYFDKSRLTWLGTSWEGEYHGSGNDIWTDGENVYFSNGTQHLVLEKIARGNVNSKPYLGKLIAKDVGTYSKSEIDALLKSNIPDTSGFVPTSRTINGKALSANISLGNKDVGALPDYTLTINHGTAGNPRMVKFASVNYSSAATCFKMGAMTCHDNGVSYQFLTDMLIAVTTAGEVTANIYKFAQSSVGNVDGVARYTGDVFYVNDTTNKIVDFYILCGQYSSSQFTPVTKVGSTTIDYVTQYSGGATYYSSGEKVWVNGCGTTYARLSDIPTNHVTTNTEQTITGKKTFSGNGLTVSGRTSGAGDDEGIVVNRASNGYAGLCLGTPSGERSVIYLLPTTASGTRAVWRYNNGSTSYNAYHPAKEGTIALTSDISKLGTSNWKVTQDSSGNLVFTYE